MKTETGGPAFPRPASENTEQGTLFDGNQLEPAQVGLSILDYFAAQALAGLMQFEDAPPAKVAEGAYNVAVAMVAESKRRQS